MISMSKLNLAQGYELLSKLHPADGSFLVGTGYSNAIVFNQPKIHSSRKIFIDAQEDRITLAKNRLSSLDQWQVKNVLLADAPGERVVHYTNNALESGLIPAEQLQAIWPAIKTSRQEARLATTVDQVIADNPEIDFSEVNQGWMVIDCLSSLSVMKGSVDTIPKCKVIWVRVIKEEITSEALGDQSSLFEVDRFLKDYGFECKLIFEENHPEIVQAVFIRDDVLLERQRFSKDIELANQIQASALAERDARVQQLSQALAEANQAREALAAEKHQLAAAQAEHGKQVAERDAKVQQLNQALAEANQAREALAAEKHQLSATQAEHGKQVAERDAQLQQLNQALAEANHAREALAAEKNQLVAAQVDHGKQITERDLKQQELAQALAKSNKAKDVIENEKNQLSLVLAEQEALKDELTDQVKQLSNNLIDAHEEKSLLENKNHELEKQMKALSDEILKAEAQIELIKDLVLREEGV